MRRRAVAPPRVVGSSTAGFIFSLLLTLLVGAVPAAAAALTIVAAELTTDATGRVVAAGGVRISDGATTALGERAVLDPRRRLAVLTPGTVRSAQGMLRARRLTVRYTPARVTDVTAVGDASAEFEGTRILADEIILRPATEEAVATGHVLLMMPPDLRAQGSQLTYQRRTGRVTLSGPVSLRNADGTATARRLEARVGVREVRLRDNVEVRFGRITARADTATVIAPAKRVVLAGGVRVAQDGRVLWAPRVTVDYGTGRVTAQGPVKIQIMEAPAAP